METRKQTNHSTNFLSPPMYSLHHERKLLSLYKQGLKQRDWLGDTTLFHLVVLDPVADQRCQNPRPIHQEKRIPIAPAFAPAFAWSAVVLDVKWVFCVKIIQAYGTLTQHPPSVAATHQAHGCHVERCPVRSTKALLHLLLLLVTALVVPKAPGRVC